MLAGGCPQATACWRLLAAQRCKTPNMLAKCLHLSGQADLAHLIAIVSSDSWTRRISAPIKPSANLTAEIMTSPSDGSRQATSQVRNDTARQIAITGNRLDSGELFQSTRELIITHGEETYRLRLTSQNKLILTK
jgi:hemin uptake protein HemP